MLKTSPILVILSVVFAVFAFAQDDQGWEEIRDEASGYVDDYDYEAAREAYGRALEAAVVQGADYDSRIQLQLSLGKTLLELGEYEQADEHLLAALALIAPEFGTEDSQVADCLSLLADAAVGRDDSAQAEAYLTRALAIRRQRLGEFHVDVVETYLSLGELYLSVDRFGEGANAFDLAIESQDGTSDDPFARADVRERVAGLYNANGYDEATEIYLLEAMDSLVAGDEALGSEISEALLDLGLTAGRWGKHSQAETILNRAIELDRRNGTPDPKISSRLHTRLAGNLARLSRLSEAELEARLGVDILRKANLELEGGYEEALVPLGRYLGEQNKWAEAEDVYLTAWNLARKDFTRVDHWVYSVTRVSKARLRQGRIDEADQLFEELAGILAGIDGLTATQLSKLYEQQGNLYLDRVYDPDAGDSGFYYAAGDLYSDEVLLARAAIAYEHMVELRREDGRGRSARELFSGLGKLSGVYAEQDLDSQAQSLEQEMAFVGVELVAELFLEWWNEPDKPTYLGLTVIGWSGILCAAFVGAFVAVIAWLILSRPPPEPVAFGAAAAPVPDQLPTPVRPFPLVGPVFPAEIETALPAAEIPNTRQFAFHADGGSLFAIWIVNTLLTLVTLGTYSFWGKSRIRRYLWAQIELGGDRFAYHGTGLELFVGWLKALPVILVVVYAQVLVPLIWEDKMAPLLGVGITVVGMLGVWPLAVVGSYRYRLSRTSWRGIRFSFRGNTWEYVKIHLVGSLLWIVTLGFYTPYFNMRIRRYLFEHTWFGNYSMSFSGEGRDLMGKFLIAVALKVPTLTIYDYWYEALRERYYWSKTCFGDGQFRLTLRGGELCKVRVTNFLLLIVTVGLAWPWTIIRSSRLYLENLHLDGRLDFEGITQEAQEVSATAEGFADFIDIDVFGF